MKNMNHNIELTEEDLKKLVESEKKHLQCKRYLNFLSKNKNVGMGATLKETLRKVLSLVDEKGSEQAILELGVPSFYINKILRNREDLEQAYNLVLV